ncbi:MAG: glycosyl hydrolase, partial [Pseudomonadota bacterium]|nr:glycosyl hydrolase [Pseudomonadota bacterium]
LAGDCLQLARYGLRLATDPALMSSIQGIDTLLKTDTPNGPVWHRYNGDGYGEHRDGSPFDGCGRGRGWPLLTGERGHFALLAGENARPYLRAMTRMTGPGGLLPEQVWDSDPIPEHDLFPGQPSGSAMPLVWAHAEYIKLALSLASKAPVDRPARTFARYGGKKPVLDYALWQPKVQLHELAQGQALRFLLPEPALVHWGKNGWKTIQDEPTQDWGLGHVAILATSGFSRGTTIEFTFYWPQSNTWQQEDFQINIT